MHASARRTALRALARGVSSSASTNACATRTNATAFLASRASTSPSLPARVRAASRARRAFASDTHDDFKPKVADASNEDVERAIAVPPVDEDVQTARFRRRRFGDWGVVDGGGDVEEGDGGLVRLARRRRGHGGGRAARARPNWLVRDPEPRKYWVAGAKEKSARRRSTWSNKVINYGSHLSFRPNPAR